ncbi:hypothetical protein PTSG_09717 [Salpingoeca rosetta]|uniref:GPS domain-containing protein n=1 Tax=Salpingoeca rosetta (strain ATCC 50818 / BSB-021) TaxID=946362 RepID=F2UNU6_SALR5|nr:uncharacterized protein PTSG_09717 [Salpingoeca rosetta]EGD79301.1 hypothetical protein PTSG_09717 [Salpingoeca rosetta]|eukprot:XP_004989072.1 hypothetical protein PTSG_09717 [Salpingoeca rosetta]
MIAPAALLGLVVLATVLAVGTTAAAASSSSTTTATVPLFEASLAPADDVTSSHLLIPGVNASIAALDQSSLYRATVDATGLLAVTTTRASNGLSIQGEALAEVQAVVDVQYMDNITLALTASTLTNHSVTWELVAVFDDGGAYRAANGSLLGEQATTVTTTLALNANAFAAANLFWRLQTTNASSHVVLHNITASAVDVALNRDYRALHAVRQVNITGLPSGAGTTASGITDAGVCALLCEGDITCSVAVHDASTAECTTYTTPALTWGATTGAATTGVSVFMREIAGRVATVNTTHRHTADVSRRDIEALAQPLQLSGVPATATLNDITLPIVFLEADTNACAAASVNVTVFSTSAVDFSPSTLSSSSIIGDRVASASATAATVPTIAADDEENVLLAPNWWTGVPLFWDADAPVPSIANLDTLLVVLHTSLPAGCRAVTFAASEANATHHAAFVVDGAPDFTSNTLTFTGQTPSTTLALEVSFSATATDVLSTTDPEDHCTQFTSKSNCDASQACAWYGCRPTLLNFCGGISDEQTCEQESSCAYDYEDNKCFVREDAVCTLLSCPILVCQSFTACLPVAEAFTCRSAVSQECNDHTGCSASIDCIAQQVAECGATSECLSVCPFHLLQSDAHVAEVQQFTSCLQNADQVDGGLLGALVGLLVGVLDLLLGTLLLGTTQVLLGAVTAVQHTLLPAVNVLGAILSIDILGVVVSVVTQAVAIITSIPAIVPSLLPDLSSSACTAEMLDGIAWPNATGAVAVAPCPSTPGAVAYRYCCESSSPLGLLGALTGSCGTPGWLDPDVSQCNITSSSSSWSWPSGGLFGLGLLDNLQSTVTATIVDTTSAIDAVLDITGVLQQTASAFVTSALTGITSVGGGGGLGGVLNLVQSAYTGLVAQTLELAFSTISTVVTQGLSLTTNVVDTLLGGVASVLQSLDLAGVLATVQDLSSAVLSLLGSTIQQLITIVSSPLPLLNTLLSLVHASTGILTSVLARITDLSTSQYFLNLISTNDTISIDTTSAAVLASGLTPSYLQNTVTIPAELSRLGQATVLAHSPLVNVSITTVNSTIASPPCALCSVREQGAGIVSDVVDVTLASGRNFTWPSVSGAGNAGTRDSEPARLTVAFNMSHAMDHPRSDNTDIVLRTAMATATTLSSHQLRNSKLRTRTYLQAIGGPVLEVKMTRIPSLSESSSASESSSSSSPSVSVPLPAATDEAPKLCKDPLHAGKGVSATTNCRASTSDSSGGGDSVTVTFQLVCHWWDPSARTWNTSGCATDISDDGSRVTCTCSHTTSYAVLMKSDGVSTLSSTDTLALQLITYVGSGFSVAALVLAALVYAYVWNKPFVKEHHRLVVVLAVILVVGQCLLLVMLLTSGSLTAGSSSSSSNDGTTSSATEAFTLDSAGGNSSDAASAASSGSSSDSSSSSNAGCVGMAFALHFSLVLGFAWMIVIGVNIYRSFVDIMDQQPISIPRALLACILASAAVAGITYAASPSTYTSTDYCWLDMNTSSLYGFAVPLGVMLVVNTCLMASSLRSISKEATTRVQARAGFTFAWILGLTWVFAAMAIVDVHTVAWQYLFAVFSVLQGVFIFAHYVALSERMRDALFSSSEQRLHTRQQTMAKVRAHGRGSNSHTPSSYGGRTTRPSTCSTSSTNIATSKPTRESAVGDQGQYIEIMSSCTEDTVFTGAPPSPATCPSSPLPFSRPMSPLSPISSFAPGAPNGIRAGRGSSDSIASSVGSSIGTSGGGGGGGGFGGGKAFKFPMRRAHRSYLKAIDEEA